MFSMSIKALAFPVAASQFRTVLSSPPVASQLPPGATGELRHLNASVAATITSNTGLAAMPGNVFLRAAASGLPRDSVGQLHCRCDARQDRHSPTVGRPPAPLKEDVDREFRRVLGLEGVP
jgi:hypothetical protein